MILDMTARRASELFEWKRAFLNSPISEAFGHEVDNDGEFCSASRHAAHECNCPRGSALMVIPKTCVQDKAHELRAVLGLCGFQLQECRMWHS